MNYFRSLKISKVIFFLSSLYWGGVVFAGIYELDYVTQRKEAQVQTQEGIFIRLRFKEKVDKSLPIFLYQIKKIRNPHKITNKLFEDSLFFLEKGNLFFSQGDYLKAIKFYKKSYRVNPSFISSYHNMGLAYFLSGAYNQSIKSFEKVIEISPLNPYSYFYLGWIYKKLESPRLAQSYLRKAKEICESVSNKYLLENIEVLLSELEFEEFIDQ